MQLPVEAKFRQTFSLGWEEGFEFGLPRPPRPPRPPRLEKDDMKTKRLCGFGVGCWCWCCVDREILGVRRACLFCGRQR